MKNLSISPTILFWIINICFWVTYYAINGTSFLLYLTYEPFDRFLGLATLTFWILLFTGIYTYLYHRFQFNNKSWQFQIIQVLVSTIIIFRLDYLCVKRLNHLIFPFIQGIDTFSEKNYYIKLLFSNKGQDDINALFDKLNQHNDNMKVFAILTWIAAYNLIQYYVLLRKTQVKQLEVENHLKEAELTYLRQQLNPHFLFNALNSIHALASLKEDKTESAVLNLSDLMRYHLNYEKRDFVTVKEEIDTVRKYLELEKIRYENRLTYDIQVEEAILNQQIPLIMVQTLVENAIKHSVRHNPKGGSVKIKAYQDNGFLKIEVINSGQYTPSVSTTKNSGIGLENTRKRLEMLYGGKASLSIGNKNDSEVMAILSFPIK